MIACAFLLTVIGILFIMLQQSNQINEKTHEQLSQLKASVADIVKEKENSIYKLRLKGVLSILKAADKELAATLDNLGLAGTDMAFQYEEEVKNSVLENIKNSYYKISDKESDKESLNGVYPFIVDNNGIVVLHPEYSKGETRFKKESFIQEMFSSDEAFFSTEIDGEKKFVFSVFMPEWQWAAAFAIPEKVLLAPAYSVEKSLEIFQKRLDSSMDSLLHVVILFVVFIAVISLIVLGLLISRFIIANINVIIQGLNEGAGQVAASSAQVSSASQSLAEKASQQAAAIEETSSSMNEMADKTRHNAQKANQAARLIENMKNVIASADQAMSQLTHSMDDISHASSETSKIIKTIDEIAFQTNLLALNAAVEAARAGSAGAGFAVVAEEVRSLAMRTAEAAKNTEGLIDGTIHKVHEGSRVVSMSNETFSQVTQSADKVSSLVFDIVNASEEQASGITQINKAINEIGDITQENAANAEESASASLELDSHSDKMESIVQQLVNLVNGKK
jgi:methyl-accepting chemotaxis protein